MPSAAVTPSGRLTEYAVSTVEALHRELRPPDQTAVTVALTGSEQAQLRVLAEMSSRVGQLLVSSTRAVAQYRCPARKSLAQRGISNAARSSRFDVRRYVGPFLSVRPQVALSSVVLLLG